jgi:CHASE2 domain-containing sensor protein
MKRNGAVIAIGTLLLGAVIFFRPLRFIDNLWYDLLFVAAAPAASDPVVVVGIDARSIDRHGAFPWSRSTLAALVEAIDRAGPAAIAIDILFPRREDAAGNDSLTAVFSRTKNLVLPFRADGIARELHASRTPLDAALLRHRVTAADVGSTALPQLYTATTILAADTLFSRYASHAGFLNVSTSATSRKLREAVQLIRVGDDLFPSFGIAAAAAFLQTPSRQIALDTKGKLVIGNRRVPLSSHAASTPILFRNEDRPVPVLSATELLSGSFDAARLAGKLVVVGITDPAAGSDFFTTPLRSQTAGAEVWATVALDIIENRMLAPTPFPASLAVLLLALMLFPGSALLIPARKRLVALSVGGGVVLLCMAAGVAFFASASRMIDVPLVVYAYAFLLFTLAARNNEATSAGAPTIGMELPNPPDSAFPRAPAQEDFLRELPKCATMDYVIAATALHNEPHLLRSIANGTMVRLLGSGGMADVYLVWNERLETYRAVKVLNPQSAENFLSRFETEIRIIANLDHPNIVHCYTAGTWHTLPFLEMEYVHGTSIEEVLKKWGNLTLDQTLFIGCMVCRALQYAHNQVVTIYGKRYRGIVHRDLKPANIMMSRTGLVKLTDFGIARPGDVSLHTVERGNVVGTLPYLAPEQLGNNELAGSADIYALGATLYECVSGERAFPQQELPALLCAKSGNTFKPLVRAASIPSEVAVIIEKAMDANPAKRYASARAFGEALERVLLSRCGADVTAVVEALVQRVWRD